MRGAVEHFAQEPAKAGLVLHLNGHDARLRRAIEQVGMFDGSRMLPQGLAAYDDAEDRITARREQFELDAAARKRQRVS